MESSERLASPPSTSAEVVVAVLGATGFLGRLLVREAARAGYSVRAVVRPSADPRAVAQLLSKDSRNKVAVVRCETVGSPPSSSSSAPLSAALSGCSAVLCALAGRKNTGGARGVARMRSVEVDGIVSCFEAFLRSSPPPPSRASFPRRRFVAFAPPVRQLTRGGTRRPFSEYVVAKEEMERRLKVAAEAAFKVEEQQKEAKAGEASSNSSSKGGRSGPADNASPPPAVAVTVFEVAAWGRDSEPIAAGLLRSKGISLVVAGGANRLQPLDEGDLAARVVRGLSLPRDVSSSSSSSSSSNNKPFTVVSVGGPRVLSWSELVREAGRSVGVERPLLVSLPRWALEKGVLPAAELASRVFGRGGSGGIARAGYLARLAADVMATDLVAEEAVFRGGGGGGEARL